MENKTLYPGDTVGIVGTSAHAAMLVTAARKMGFLVGAYGADETNEALQLADFKVVGSPTDREKLQRFAEKCDVVTYDSEAVRTATIEYISRYTSVPQGYEMQEMMQDRLLERAFYEQLNVNIAPYATITDLDDVYQTINSIGYPAVLKPIQKEFTPGRELVIHTQTDIAKASGLLDWGTFVLESQVPFERELAMLVAVDADDNRAYFPIVECTTQGDQLQQAWLPSQIDAALATEIKRVATEVANHMTYTGVFEVAFYVTNSGALYVKKIVPAPADTGYLLGDATTVSEFEEHLRAIAGLPLAQPESLTGAALATFTTAQLQAIRTQWVLKGDWHFNFYHRRRPQPDDLAGHITVQGDSVRGLLDQFEDTGIWAAPSAANPFDA